MSGAAADLDREQTLLSRARSSAASERDAAFRELFDSLRQPAFALCLHITARAADAEDAVQEAFTQAFRALPHFRGEARVSTWFYRIAVRAALQVKARRPQKTDSIEDETGPPLMSHTAPASEENRDLTRALLKLSADHRIVLSLFAQGFSHAEIAEILGVPEGTVWSRLHSARKRMAAFLTEK
jgi:RNA polymerase sigma-70 factor (ECF subfamily)